MRQIPPPTIKSLEIIFSKKTNAFKFKDIKAIKSSPDELSLVMEIFKRLGLKNGAAESRRTKC